jgi:hypothetical protein
MGWPKTCVKHKFGGRKIRINLKVLFRRIEMKIAATPSVEHLLVLLAVAETGRAAARLYGFSNICHPTSRKCSQL